MKKQKISRPRNHVVVALMQRQGGSGAHRRSAKANRRAEKVQLAKEFF
jgi:hypothetical protein